MSAASPTPKRALYGERPAQPGLYLGLFHGRNGRQDDMDDWGFAGPALGPLTYCHTTYMAHIHLCFERATDARICCNSEHREVDVGVVDDMIFFEGAYYGDWTLFLVAPADCRRPDDAFRNKPRANAHQWHSRLTNAHPAKNP